jgi:hypothetical protein
MAPFKESKKHVLGDVSTSRGDHGLPGMSEDHLTEDEKKSGTKPHTCTDILCTVIFIACMVGVFHVMGYAREKGNIKKLFYGMDFQGNVCGVDSKVADSPFLYYCPLSGNSMAKGVTALAQGVAGGRRLEENRTLLKSAAALEAYTSLGHLDTRHPICVSKCPSSKETTSCYQGATTDTSKDEDAAGTYTETTKYSFKFVQAYDSKGVGGRLCMPQSRALLQEMDDQASFSVNGLMKTAGEVYSSWPALVAAGGLAIIVGYLYLFLLQHLMAPIIYLTILLASTLPLVAGCACLYGAYQEQADAVLAKYGSSDLETQVAQIPDFPSTGNFSLDVGIGGALCTLGLLVALFACCCRHSIQLVIGTLEAACECLRDNPTFLVQPLVSTVSKGIAFTVLGGGLCLLATCGKVEPYEVAEGVPTGLTRSFTWTDEQQKYLLFYTFMTFWILEIMNAFDQFVIAYASQLWYFRDYVSIAGIRKKPMVCFPAIRGLIIGVVFHFGTMAVGAFLLAALKMIYICLSLIMRQVEAATGDDEGKPNCLVRAMLGCCACCVTLWDSIIRFMNSKVYIVTAIESESFCGAASKAFTIVASEIGAVGALEGAIWVLSIGGVLVITGLGSFLTWIVIHRVDQFSNPESEFVVTDPEAVTAVAGVISFVIAMSFMVVFDMIAETMIFCWALDRQREAEGGLFAGGGGNHTPSRLSTLMDHTGDNNSDHSNGSRKGLLK